MHNKFVHCYTLCGVRLVVMFFYLRQRRKVYDCRFFFVFCVVTFEEN